MFDGLEPAGVSAHFAPPRAAVRFLTLEQMLVWAYRDQKVDRMSARQLHDLEAQAEGDYEPHGTSGCGVAAVAAIAAVGARIPGGGCWGGSAECHPDAEALHEALCEFGRERWLDALCLLQSAREGQRPEPSTVQPVPYPTPAEAGDDYGTHEEDGRRYRHKLVTAERVSVVVPVIRRTGRGRVKVVGTRAEVHEVRYCSITWHPDPSYVEAVNEIARRWRDALAAFAEFLEERGVAFRAHALTGEE